MNRGVGMYGGGETKKVDVDGKRKTPDDEGARSSLEHAVNIVARSPPRGLQLRGDGDTIAGTYQEGWLRADSAAGTPGVVAVDMTLPVGGDSGGDSVSDTVSNSIRVVKVYVQTSKVPIGYAAAVSEVLAARGLGGLLWSGLPAKLLCNGISSIVFSVAWKGLMERYKKANPPKRDDGEDVEPLLPR